MLPAPTAPSVRSAGVRDQVRLRSPVVRSWLTQLRRRFQMMIRIRRRVQRPFTALLGSILFPRFPSPREVQAAATERSTLPAPLADWSDELSICLHPEGFQRLSSAPSPAGGDRTLGPWSSLVRLPFPPMARNRRPDHPPVMGRAPSRSKRNLCHQACG